MNKTTDELLNSFENLIQDLRRAKYDSIAKILNGLKQVFLKEIQ